MGARQQLGNGPPPKLAVVDRVGVHVHADEAVGARGVEPAAESLSVRQRLGPMGETVLDAGLQIARNRARQLVAEVAPNNIAAEWPRR